MKLKIDIKNWSWKLELKTEIDNYPLHLQYLKLKIQIENWNLKLKLRIEIDNWNWQLKSEIEIGNWNWTLKLKLKIELKNWNWKLKLKIDIENWNWKLKLTINPFTYNICKLSEYQLMTDYHWPHPLILWEELRIIRPCMSKLKELGVKSAA